MSWWAFEKQVLVGCKEFHEVGFADLDVFGQRVQ
jgi:hypothetical protein